MFIYLSSMCIPLQIVKIFYCLNLKGTENKNFSSASSNSMLLPKAWSCILERSRPVSENFLVCHWPISYCRFWSMLHEINLDSEREEEEYLLKIRGRETLQISTSSTRLLTLFFFFFKRRLKLNCNRIIAYQKLKWLRWINENFFLGLPTSALPTHAKSLYISCVSEPFGKSSDLKHVNQSSSLH